MASQRKLRRTSEERIARRKARAQRGDEVRHAYNELAKIADQIERDQQSAGLESRPTVDAR